MPFWQQVQRCENCAYWNRSDPSSPCGLCQAEWHTKGRPYWAEPRFMETQWDDGAACAAYRHESRRPHPLDDARAFIALSEVGDIIPMRTYSRGNISRTNAEVLYRNNSYITVRMLNGTYRLRLNSTNGHHAGTIIGMDEWGVDMQGEIKRHDPEAMHPERAIEIVASTKPGDHINLIGLPPFHRMRKTAKVLGKSDKYLTIRIDRSRRKSKMHASGPLAGIIEGEVWTLDTTGEPA